MTIGGTILSWAADRPGWQQVALRMLTQAEQLSGQQITVLAALALRDLGHAPLGMVEEQSVLRASDLGTMAEGRGTVCLLGLHDIQGVNQLAPEQALEFAPEGATVIYGDNGTGKSGYARIIKRISGARDAGDPILPNVFEGTAPARASATVKFSVAGKEDSQDWTDGPEASRALPEIGFFDLHCAQLQINRENEVMFTPAGLDLIARVGTTCSQVRERLQDLRRDADAAAPLPVLSPEYDGTFAARVVAGLGDPTDLSRLSAVPPLSPDEQAELTRLISEQASDPELVISKCALLERTLTGIDSRLRTFSEALAEEAVGRHTAQAAVVAATAEAASLARGDLFNDEPLSGVGGEAWKVLWDAAARYSTKVAYIGEDFPVVGEGRVCVLCQQPLSVEAQERLLRFTRYVQDETARTHERACAALDILEQPLANARAALETISPQVALLSEELPALCEELERQLALLRSEAGYPAPNDAARLRGVVDEVSAGVQREQAALAAKRAAAEGAQDPVASEARGPRIKELRARDALASQSDRLVARIDALEVLRVFDRAIEQCDTTRVSRFASALAAEFVTERLEAAFRDERKHLGFRVPVALAGAGSRRGVSRHKVDLEGAALSVPLLRVLSEGEQKCVALAGFLAEMKIKGDSSGVVLDDPVTSLDHRWRTAVAERLAGLAQKRQVIIFTHDIVFLSVFLTACENLGVSVHTANLQRGAKCVGVRHDGLPWQGMRVKERIGAIKQAGQKAGAVHRKEGPDAYEPLARTIYAMLRETWERAVEEVLFSEVIQRFTPNVQMMRLRNVDLTKDHVEAACEGWEKCSGVMIGHDHAASAREDAPSPEELEEDVAALEAWVQELRAFRGGK